jgi:hypothetical protein
MYPEDDIPIDAEPNPINPRAFKRAHYTPLNVSYYQQKGMPKGQINASYYTDKGAGAWASTGPGGTSMGGTMNITPNLSLDVSSAPNEKRGMLTYRKQF